MVKREYIVVKSPKSGWNIKDQHGNPAVARVLVETLDGKALALHIAAWLSDKPEDYLFPADSAK